MKKLAITNTLLLLAVFMVGFSNSTYAQCGTNVNPTNTCAGDIAGDNMSTGTSNSYFGRAAGLGTTSGNNNAFFGSQAGFVNTTGQQNSFFGSKAGRNSTGRFNSFYGFSSGANNLTGEHNTFFGVATGTANTTGSYVSLFGRGADVGSDGLTFATAVGGGAVVTDNNTVQLGRDGFDTVRIGMLGEITMPPPVMEGREGGYPYPPMPTMVCLNDDNELAACPMEMFPIFFPTDVLRSNVEDQTKTIAKQERQLKSQQGQIEALRNTICSMNSKAAVCRQ